MTDENRPGVGAEPIAEPQPSGLTPPASAPVSPPAKVDLTTIPGFSEFQSKKDREIAEVRAEAARMAAQLQQIQAESARAAQERARQELAQIETLDAPEQAKLLRERLAAVEREKEAAAASARVTSQAMAILNDAGIALNDPRLESIRQMPATPDLIPALSRVVVAIQRQEREAMAAELAEARKPKDTKAETAREVVRALDDAGVTAVSNGQSVVAPVSPNEEARQKLLKEYKSFAGKGIDNPAYRAFTERLINMGKTTGDLYRPWE